MQLKENNSYSLTSFCKNRIGNLYKFFHPKFKNIVVFCYHDITNKPTEFQIKNKLYTTTGTFIKQIKYINNNFQIINPRSGWEDGSIEKKYKPKAIITFDDGYYGAFNNGLRILLGLKIPSIIFLNMKNILDRTPLVSSACLYLEKEGMVKFEITKNKKSKHLHLNIDASSYKNFDRIINKNIKNINKYQGMLANIYLLKKYDNPQLISYANHLYEHFNSIALTNEELVISYQKNEIELKKFNSYINYFAFTNGRYKSCWNEQTAEVIKNCGAKKIFSADGKVNYKKDKYILDRIALNEDHDSENKIMYAVLRGLI